MLTPPVLGKTAKWSDFIRSGDRLFIGSHAAVPNQLIQHLIDHSPDMHDLELVHIHTLSESHWAKIDYISKFKVNALYIGEGVRQAIADGYADYTPCFTSEIPSLFADGTLALDAALIMVSPPDEFGYCSMGVSVDVVSSAVKHARFVIAQINPRMPRTNGDTFIHVGQIHAVLQQSVELPELYFSEPDDVTESIALYVASLIEDGATLQLGIGDVPEAVLKHLHNHRDLGIHSEMIGDGVMRLIQKGVVNNRRKTYRKNKTVVSFCMGSRELYDFVDSNPHIEFLPSEQVNSPAIISRNDNMISINTAIEIDLTGQVVSDSIGYQFYSGIGGQVDFIRGAAMSKGGKPIIALASTTKDGSKSKIVPYITEGGGVVNSRGTVDYVVTEFGIATLRGKSIRERALELIRIAHPKFRDDLLTEVRKHYWVPEYQKQKPSPVKELGLLELKPLLIHDQRYILRPLYPADERRLQEFFYSHSKQTLMMRYNFEPKQMTRQQSAKLVAVDQTKDLALCITEKQGSSETIQAVGRYYYNPNDNSAEVAFVVSETKRGKGMAKTLLAQMATIARIRKLEALLAYVRKDNAPMLKVFEDYGFRRVPGEPGSELSLKLELVKEESIS